MLKQCVTVFLDDLVVECGSELEENNLLWIVQQYFIIKLRKYALLRNYVNKIVSKYYLYYLKYKYLCIRDCLLDYLPLK